MSRDACAPKNVAGSNPGAPPGVSIGSRPAGGRNAKYVLAAMPGGVVVDIARGAAVAKTTDRGATVRGAGRTDREDEDPGGRAVAPGAGRLAHGEPGVRRRVGGRVGAQRDRRVGRQLERVPDGI